MPNYTFRCKVCPKEVTYYMTYTEMKETAVMCPACWERLDGGDNNPNGELAPFMERVLKATSTAIQTKETIDNGLQVKKVEQLAGVAEMIRERSDDNDKS